MRKTSHDGIDATSITSSIENELKKAGANFSKIKKSSIKRKVQNFSHESDEGIIEPLLQIEKEKADIANRSAKFLLNKSKTDSSYERDNKSSDNFALSGKTLSTPPSSTSKVISATLKDRQSSTSYMCGTAPMHNHMNTNVFSTYDVSKGIPASKNQILVEIDGCKSGSYNPSPLIFTTAKIHTDSKSKLMEPVQTTPVPILSTIEGNAVKTLTNNSERHVNSLPIKPVDQIINKTNKLDTNELQSDTGKAHISRTVTTVSSNEDDISLKEVTNLNECKNKNVKELQARDALIDAPETCVINQSTGQFTSNNIKSMLPTTTNSSNLTTTKNMKDGADSLPNNKFSIDSAPVSTNSLKETSYINRTTLSEMSISYDKNKSTALIGSDNKALKSNVQSVDLQMENNKAIYLKLTKESQFDMSKNVTKVSKISPLPGKLTSEEISRAVKLKESLVDDKTYNTFKAPIASGSKKLQRQKNAAVDEINETNNISSSFSVEKSNITDNFDKKFIASNEKVFCYKGDYKSDGTSSFEKFSTGTKSSPINETQPSTTASLPKSMEDATSKSKIKSTTEVNSVTFSSFEDVTKTQTKSPIVSTTPTTKNNTKLTSVATIKSQSSSKASTGNTSVMETFSKPDKSSNYTVVPTTSKCISTVKCDSTTASTTLPSYIVSTSKTKIGSTLTTDTLKNTTKSSSQQPFAEILYTSNETEKIAKPRDGSTLITSSSSSANHSNFSQQTKTKTDSCLKDGRV